MAEQNGSSTPVNGDLLNTLLRHLVSNGERLAQADNIVKNGSVPLDAGSVDKIQDIVHNLWECRSQLFSKFFDPRRNYDEDCGYPSSESPVMIEMYRQLYDRDAIAARVVQLLPKESWQVTPFVYEDESSENATEFELSWDNLGRQLRGKSWFKDERGSPIWEYLLRADILSGIGTFGVILLGIDDGKLLEQPVDGAPKDGRPTDITGVSKDIYGGIIPTQLEIPFESRMGTDAQYFNLSFSPGQPPGTADKPSGERRLLFLRCFDASLVQVVQYEADIFNPRFGQPLMYWITLNDPRQPHSGVGLPLATLRVHWSRVIHLADNLNSSEIYGYPRQQQVLNRILDLRKLYGGSAEMYWRGAFPGISLETHPQLGGDVTLDVPKIREMMGNYIQGLDRFLALMGMSAKSLAPQVVSPKEQVEVIMEAICIEMGCPVRVFKGSERGELASSQDDAAWNDRLAHRQQMYITPRIIVPFIDRLIMLGVLPEPKSKTKKDTSLKLPPPPAPAQKSNTPGKPPTAGNEGEENNFPKPNSTANRAKLHEWDQWYLRVGGPGFERWREVRNSIVQGRGFAKAVQYAELLGATIIHNAQAGQTFDPDAMNAWQQSGDQGVSADHTQLERYGKGSKQSKEIDPNVGYSVEWPDLDSTTKKDKATIALQTTQALSAYVAGGVEALVPPHDFFVRVLGWDEEEAMEVISKAQSAEESDMLTPVDEPGKYKSDEPPMMLDEDGKPIKPGIGGDDDEQAQQIQGDDTEDSSKGGEEDEGEETTRNREASLFDPSANAQVQPDQVQVGADWNPVTGNFNPDQVRDDHGKWTSTGGGMGGKYKVTNPGLIREGKGYAVLSPLPSPPASHTSMPPVAQMHPAGSSFRMKVVTLVQAMHPHVYNAATRLALLSSKYGPQVLDNAMSLAFGRETNPVGEALGMDQETYLHVGSHVILKAAEWVRGTLLPAVASRAAKLTVAMEKHLSLATSKILHTAGKYGHMILEGTRSPLYAIGKAVTDHLYHSTEVVSTAAAVAAAPHIHKALSKAIGKVKSLLSKKGEDKVSTNATSNNNAILFDEVIDNVDGLSVNFGADLLRESAKVIREMYEGIYSDLGIPIDKAPTEEEIYLDLREHHPDLIHKKVGEE